MYFSDILSEIASVMIMLKNIIQLIPPVILVVGIVVFGMFLLINTFHLFLRS